VDVWEGRVGRTQGPAAGATSSMIAVQNSLNVALQTS
jgi:hypothetical protein